MNASSISVYPEIDGEFSESSYVKPSINSDAPYGLSKLISENLFDYFLAEMDTKVTHLRIAQVYGEGMRKDRIIPTLEKQFATEGKMTLWGNGERETNFIHIDVLTELLEFFITENHEGGIFNVGHEQLDLVQIARKIALKKGNFSPTIDLVEKGRKASLYSIPQS